MTRGGKGVADGYSPYKKADGSVLKLLKSSNSKTGYLNIVEPHPGKFYPKKKLDGEPGTKKMKIFGKGQPTARMAAIVLAEFLDKPYELPTAKPRKLMDTEMKKERRLAWLSSEAHKLLGIAPAEQAELEQMAREAEVAMAAIANARASGASGASGVPVASVCAIDPNPMCVPVHDAHDPYAQFDAAIMKKAARLAAMSPV